MSIQTENKSTSIPCNFCGILNIPQNNIEYHCQKCKKYICNPCQSKKYNSVSWPNDSIPPKNIFICGKCSGTRKLLKLL